MTEFTIYRDSREKRPYDFDTYPVSTENVHLETADYVVAGDGHYKDDGEVFVPRFGVERKAKGDFLSSITHDRDRFEAELRRADGWESRMPIVVEERYIAFQNGDYYPDIHPNSIMGTVEKWPNYYNADFYFCRNRESAAELVYEFLSWRHSQL